MVFRLEKMTSRAAMLVELAKKSNTSTTDPTVIGLQPKYSNMLLVKENMDMDIDSTEQLTTDQPTVPVPQLYEEEINSGDIGMKTLLHQNEELEDEERINSTEPPTVAVPQLDKEEIQFGHIGMETLLQQNEEVEDEERINSTEPPTVPVPQLDKEEIHFGHIGMETLQQNEDPEDAERIVELNSSDVNISIPSELLDINNIDDFILLDTAGTIDEQVKIIDEDERLVGDLGTRS
ncbi:hypothetical protein LSTR_LSTR009565 [Laodelphax striatellus]|uniref:Uncharacterized protein n=1 Tax=Laodelphax striatellus TaxID=195883 RepID=A0A482WQ41_LAOST|nr:hypothetical protein LSTR_LSTR009565 [Laodelphax striatellus]